MQCFIEQREKKKYLWKSEWKSTEKPATASLNYLPGMWLCSPVAMGTVGPAWNSSLNLSHVMHQMRKDVLTAVCSSLERCTDGQLSLCHRVTVTQHGAGMEQFILTRL